MIDVTGNLWTYPADWRVITTNLYIKSNGELVMGRGCAFEANKRYSGLARELGWLISNGQQGVIVVKHYRLITFPVKKNWFDKADLKMIEASTAELRDLARGELQADTIVMPRPGCGNGKLDYEDVGPRLISLPNNVHVITYG